MPISFPIFRIGNPRPKESVNWHKTNNKINSFMILLINTLLLINPTLEEEVIRWLHLIQLFKTILTLNGWSIGNVLLNEKHYPTNFIFELFYQRFNHSDWTKPKFHGNFYSLYNYLGCLSMWGLRRCGMLASLTKRISRNQKNTKFLSALTSVFCKLHLPSLWHLVNLSLKHAWRRLDVTMKKKKL